MRDQARRLDANELAAPPSMRPADLLAEASTGLFARPARLALTVLGTVIGIAALVATLGLSRTAGNRIVGRFDALAATQVLATAKQGPAGPSAGDLPWDAGERMRRLNGVAAAGTLTVVDVGATLVQSSAVVDPGRQAGASITVYAASPGLWQAVRADLRTGRLPDRGHSQRNDQVAVLGSSAALKLGIDRVDHAPAIRLGDEIFVVVGIVESVAREPALLGSVIIPEGTAASLYRLATPETVVIETDIGAAQLIAKQAPVALRPDDSTTVRVSAPPEPRRVRENVQSDLDVLFLVLGAVSLLVGAIGIANVTLVSVMERTGEIGLRRALGASRRHVAVQFLSESAVLGLIGGIMGASLGTLVTVGISARQRWTPVLDLEIPLAAPLLGIVIGLVAGAYPAWRAAGLEPVDALRSGL
jgi:ABC-type antimicrobial peptide transport system permease subunit